MNLLKIIVFSILAFFANRINASSWTEIYQSVSGSIAVITTEGKGICSGTLIEKDKILTAAHCVGNLREVTIGWIDKIDFGIAAKVLALDFDNDLAILSIPPEEERKIIPIISEETQVKVGDDIATIGHPLAISSQSLDILKDQTFVLSRGIISKINAKNIMTDASVSPGNSGGPVLNAKGQIIGVMSKKNVAFGSGDNATLTNSDQVKALIAYVKSPDLKPLRWYQASSTIYSTISNSTFSFLKESNSENMDLWGIGIRVDFADRLPIALQMTFKENDNSFIKGYLGYMFSFHFQKFLSFGIAPIVGVLSHRFEGSVARNSSALTYGALLDIYLLSFEVSSFRIYGKSESTATISINFRWGH